MIADVLAGNNYINVNIRLAKLTDLYTAVYFGEVLNIITRVCAKKVYDEEGFFTLDRKYIESRTTLGIDEQLNCDIILSRLGDVLMTHPENPDKIRVNLAGLLAILIDESVQKPDAVKKKAKASKSAVATSKAGYIKSALKKGIKEEDEELKKFYEDWIDSAYNNKRITKVVVELFEKTINDYTQDKQTKLKLIQTCIVNGWSDATWAINAQSRNNSFKKKDITPGTRLPEQKVAKELSQVEL